MDKIKHKIISLDKDKIHIIAIKSSEFSQDNFKALSDACNGIGLRALLIAVKDVNDVRADEIGKINLILADGKVVDIEKCGKDLKGGV